MEICLNEYIRTKNGKIDKVINDNYYISEYIECEKGIVDKENIKIVGGTKDWKLKP